MSKPGSAPNEKEIENITNAVERAVDPIVGEIAPVKSKGFLSNLRKVIYENYKSIMSISSASSDFDSADLTKELFLPAQSPDFKRTYYNKSDHHKAILRMEDVKMGDVKLATFQIDNSESDDPKEKKYIIHFNGNGMYANQCGDEMYREAMRHMCVVINFDYPGVGESTGSSSRPEDMVNAGLAQVKRLQDMGVPAENIILKGQSIGGGVATLTTAKLHEQGYKVSVFNQRSFSRLSEAAKYMVGGGVIGKIVAFLVKKIGWEMDTLAAWEKIPEEYKDFSFAKKDTVIPPRTAGLAGALGKADDEERELDMGHNDQIYSSNFNKFVVRRFGNPQDYKPIREGKSIGM